MLLVIRILNAKVSCVGMVRVSLQPLVMTIQVYIDVLELIALGRHSVNQTIASKANALTIQLAGRIQIKTCDAKAAFAVIIVIAILAIASEARAAQIHRAQHLLLLIPENVKVSNAYQTLNVYTIASRDIAVLTQAVQVHN